MAKENSAPNLLVIMSDQHSGRVMGCAGDALARTPNLDALAARGVRFRRAYCGNPLCVPSRMSFLAAQHCSDIEVWSNGCLLRTEIPTFLHGLGAAGYETVLCGRMHFEGADHRHGFEKHLVGDVTSQWPGTRGPDLGHIPVSSTGQSRPAVEVAGPGRTAYQAYDRAVTDGAVEFLHRRGRAAERPFCLVVGYVLPHCPFICPRDLFERYYALVDVPRLSEAERAYLHPAVVAWRRRRGVEGLTDEQVRTARAAYYGLVEMCDGFVGEVIEALAAAGLAESTAVFYTSDHGDMAGRHEMWWKTNFYEDSVGVPLIASWPGRLAEGVEVRQAASLLDVGPTLLELAGAGPLPRVSGRSLAAFLRGQGAPPGWRDEVFSELHGDRGDPPARMICRGPWKLVHFHGYDEPQLFNIEEDPDEIHDRARDPASASVRDELHARVREGWSGQRVVDAMALLRERTRVLKAWSQAVRPPDPDHWVAPEGCNVFPET